MNEDQFFSEKERLAKKRDAAQSLLDSLDDERSELENVYDFVCRFENSSDNVKQRVFQAIVSLMENK